MSRWPAHQWWRLTSTGLCAVVLAVGFMAPTFAKDPGDVAGLRAANRAWHRCLVNQRPLVAAVKSTSAMARRAKSAVEAAADPVGEEADAGEAGDGDDEGDEEQTQFAGAQVAAEHAEGQGEALADGHGA